MLFKQRSPKVTLLPQPLIVPSSGDFDGNDGKWSSFNINIGNDGTGTGQNFKVLISTSSGLTLVPQQAGWCNADCAKERGVQTFNAQPARGLVTTGSTAWELLGIYDIPLPKWFATANLTMDPKPGGVFGKDYVASGQAVVGSKPSSKQVVVAYPDEDFYMGWLGLAAGSSGVPNGSLPNFLDNLATTANPVIPSRSFGYSVGAYYRNDQKGVPGSLVLGGYDSSRFTGSGISIDMPSASNNSLIVGVQSILHSLDPNVATNMDSFTLNNQRKEGFMAEIDSTIPYLILPNDICDMFAARYQLTYDEGTHYYFVNSSAHTRNLQQNATTSFKIGVSSTDSAEFVTINLPYAAFDWQLSFPAVNQTKQYFPIRRSGTGKSVLGRTFLQEAYLIVDYERTNFTVAQGVLEGKPTSKVVPIFRVGDTSPSSSVQETSRGLTAGAIAGIVVGIVLAFLIAAIGAYLFYRKYRHGKMQDSVHEDTSEVDTTHAGNEIKYRRVSELTGSEIPQSKDPVTGYYGAESKCFPPISEMSPESTPAELYSPPPEGENSFDYFDTGRMPRCGPTRDRDSSSNNTSHTPVAELSGEDIKHPSYTENNRGHSDTFPNTNIDEVLANERFSQAQAETEAASSSVQPGDPTTACGIAQTTTGSIATPAGGEQEDSENERRPSHTRGLSDITVQSNSTAVSQPTPEELEQWANTADGTVRPMSP